MPTGHYLKTCLLLIALVSSSFSIAGGKRAVVLLPADPAETSVLQLKRFSTDPSDSVTCLQLLRDRLTELQGHGLAEASIDHLEWKTDTVYAYLHTGPVYEWFALRTNSIPDEFLPAYLKKNGLNGDRIVPKQAARIANDIIRACEDNGYPFARVRFDSLRSTNGHITATLTLEHGKLIRIDSVLQHGPLVVAPVYLYNYIGISPGDPYNETLLSRVDLRLRELPFVQTTRTSSVVFSDRYNRLDLFIEPKKASQFDGVIGLLPDSGQNGRVRLTGDAHLKLQNSFKRGETIEFNWKQMPPRSQDLVVHALYPFLFNSPLGIDGTLKLYKRDTLFVDVEKNLGALFSLKGSNYAKIFVSNKSSSLQSTSGLSNATTLPSYADYSTTTYGTSVHHERLDYRLNPRRGTRIILTAGVGKRTIEKNSGINPAAYEGVALKTTQYNGQLELNAFVPLGGKQVAAFISRSAFVYSDLLFTNEAYRIGGLKSLRGFDEESIFASSYSMLTMEYRYLTAMNSYLFLFANGAWYENRTATSYLNDTPFGFGTGYNFETRLGILSISYALGRQFEEPIRVRNGKVHFGIVNYF